MSELNDQPAEEPERPSPEVEAENHAKALHALRGGIDSADADLLRSIAESSEDLENATVQDLIERFVQEFVHIFEGLPEDQVENAARSLLTEMQQLFCRSIKETTIRALTERFRCCAEVREHKTSTVDNGREKDVAQHWAQLIEQHGLNPDVAVRLRRIIILTSRAIQDIQASLSA